MELVDRLCADPVISAFIEQGLDEDACAPPPGAQWYDDNKHLGKSERDAKSDAAYRDLWPNPALQPVSPTSSLDSEERHMRQLRKQEILQELQASDSSGSDEDDHDDDDDDDNEDNDE
ncbi:Hypothetical Protein FCC1311_020542 [Hondaea fermentalgiana]|uniref:Uncharacterized protein n=1 Tax=Hondaea fermentalgiana TaxID=2315210 RepID=A0A2R5G5L7_9STRA|nr:Hypothetical Protein FCC1311_020542 [Hondaea fermentalgiana]|eukprot:GBG25835.1 Hypothetical Protein FCC1311_020542 [Hondaea fermentalgiana]